MTKSEFILKYEIHISSSPKQRGKLEAVCENRKQETADFFFRTATEMGDPFEQINWPLWCIAIFWLHRMSVQWAQKVHFWGAKSSKTPTRSRKVTK